MCMGTHETKLLTKQYGQAHFSYKNKNEKMKLIEKMGQFHATFFHQRYHLFSSHVVFGM